MACVQQGHRTSSVRDQEYVRRRTTGGQIRETIPNLIMALGLLHTQEKGYWH